MGYELKLVVGHSGMSRETEYENEERPTIENDGEVWYPNKRDADNQFVPTGRELTWFEVYGVVCLCKPGYESAIFELQSKYQNKDHANHAWFWYSLGDGDNVTTEDCYGEHYTPAPIGEVLNAIREDAHNDDYRRFKWALGLISAINSTTPDAEVLFYGH